jgi:sugar/nucleoside kinase (ribokinase family)
MTDSSIFSGSICVVGNVNRDLKTAPLRAGDHLFKDGETSVSSITETIGGGGANSACTVASLGAQVVFLGKVGADTLGDRLEQTLVQHGVNARLARDRQHRTGTSINLTFDNGHRHFVSCLPNNESLSFDDLDVNALSHCRHLFRADIWFSKAMLFGGNERLFQHARKLGLAISIDLNWDPRWGWSSAEEIRARKQAVRAILTLTTLVHGNVRELTEFADAADLETAASSHRLGSASRGHSHGDERRRLLSQWPADRGTARAVAGANQHDRHRRCIERLHDAAPSTNGNTDSKKAAFGQHDCFGVYRRQPSIHSVDLRLRHDRADAFVGIGRDGISLD